MRLLVLATLGVIALNGCASTSSPVPLPPSSVLSVSGVFQGSLEIEGDRVDSTLQVRQNGLALTSWLTASDFGMTADGSGTLSGRSVELTMTYGGNCPGTARLVGRIAPQTMSYTGRIVASDCTGDVEGSFSFQRAQAR